MIPCMLALACLFFFVFHHTRIHHGLFMIVLSPGNPKPGESRGDQLTGISLIVVLDYGSYTIGPGDHEDTNNSSGASKLPISSKQGLTLILPASTYFLFRFTSRFSGTVSFPYSYSYRNLHPNPRPSGNPVDLEGAWVRTPSSGADRGSGLGNDMGSAPWSSSMAEVPDACRSIGRMTGGVEVERWDTHRWEGWRWRDVVSAEVRSFGVCLFRP